MGVHRSANGGAGAFGPELVRQRQRAGWSQQVLARKAAVSRSLLSRYEAGQRHPNLRSALAIAVTLSADEGERCRLILAAGFVPPGYVVTGLRREARTSAKEQR